MCTKFIIFDFDQTLFDETIYPDAISIIKKLKLNNIHLSIASFNPYAAWLCDRYDISRFFDIICGYKADEKNQHIADIKEYYAAHSIQFNEKNAVFFDDDLRNINFVRNKTNIKCVNVSNGITSNLVFSNIKN